MASHTEQYRGIRFTIKHSPGWSNWWCELIIPKRLNGREGAIRRFNGGNRRLLRRRVLRFIDVITKAAEA